MRTTITEIDSLDEKGIFHCAPISLKDFSGDFFGCDPLIEQTAARVKEILESKPGDPLHNETHFANAIILLFGLGGYYIHYRDVNEANKILKEAETLTEKYIKQPLLLGALYLYAAKGLNIDWKIEPNMSPEYQNYIKKAFTYFNEASSANQPALFRQLVAIKPDLHLCGEMLKKFTAEQIEKVNPAEFTSLLLQYYLEPEVISEVKKIKSLLAHIQAERITPELLDFLEQNAERHVSQSAWFYRTAFNLACKIKSKDIARLARLSFKAYCKVMDTKYDKEYQTYVESCIADLIKLPVELRAQFSTTCFRIDDCQEKNKPQHMSAAYGAAYRILEAFPQKISDLIELIVRQASYNSSIPDKSEWTNYLKLAMDKAAEFLTLVKKDRQSITYFTDAALNQTICKIFEILSQSFDHRHADVEQVKSILTLVLQFVLQESEPFAHVFPSYLAFRKKVLSKFVRYGWQDGSVVSSMEKKLENEIVAFIEKNKESNSLMQQVRPIVEEFITPYNEFDRIKRLPNFLKALKGYELAKLIKDNQGILKSQLVLASFYGIEDFRHDKLISEAVSQNFNPDIGREAKKYLCEFFDKAQYAAVDDVRNALEFVRISISLNSSYFSLFETGIPLAAIAAGCDKKFIELMMRATPNECLRSKWEHLIASCCVASQQKSSEYLVSLLNELLQLNARLHENQRYDLVIFFRDSIARVIPNIDNTKFENTKLLCEHLVRLDPAIGRLFLAELENEAKIAADHLSCAASALTSDYHKKSTDMLLFHCKHVMSSSLCYAADQRFDLLNKKFTGVLALQLGIQIDQALVTVLQEIITRSKSLVVKNEDDLGYKFVYGAIHLAFRQWVLGDEASGNQTFDKLKSYMEQNIQFYNLEYNKLLINIANELYSKHLYSNASMMYELICKCSSKNKMNTFEYYYKLMHCYLHLKNKEQILRCFELIINSLRKIYSTKKIDHETWLFIDACAFDAVNKLLEEKYIDQGMAWYKFYLTLHEKIYDPKKSRPCSHFIPQFARICTALAIYSDDCDKAKYFLEKALTLYLEKASNALEIDTLQEEAIKIINKLKDGEPSNQQTQKSYYSLLNQALESLQSKKTEFLPQFIFAGTFLCDKDKTNRSMMRFFIQVTRLLIMWVRKDVESLQKLAEKLTQAVSSFSTLQELCEAKENFHEAIFSEMQVNKDLIINLQSENQQLRAQLETKSSNKRPLEENKPTADDKKTDQSDEPAAKRVKTFHASTLFQQGSSPSTDTSSEKTNENQMQL